MITVDFKRLCATRPGGLAGCRILDVGCGTGRHTCAAYRFDKVTVIGVDLLAGDVAETVRRLHFQDNLGEHGGGAWGVNVADIHHLPFANAFFDVVVCSEVMEHIDDHQAAAREVVRVLKPGGDLVVSVPRYFPERVCWALSRDYRNTTGGHVRIYKKQALVRLVESAGTKAWASHFAHSLHTPYWWLKCVVGPHRDDVFPVNLYHRFLTWDIMKKPRSTRFIDKLLNPVLGKSVVVYFIKKRKH